MTVKDQPTGDRHAAIIAFYRAHPEMTLREIGAHYGITASGVSQIISGRRGKRRQARIERFPEDNTPEPEFAAILLVIAALEHLDEHARERVIQYACARLRDPPKDTRPAQRSEKSAIRLPRAGRKRPTRRAVRTTDVLAPYRALPPDAAALLLAVHPDLRLSFQDAKF